MAAPLFFGIEVWVAVFVAIFLPSYQYRGAMPAAVEYLLILVLPQVLSAVAGAFAFIAGLVKPRRPGSLGLAFASVACLLASLGAILFHFFTGIDQWTGKAGAGWIIVLACALVAVDVAVAAPCGHFAGIAAARRATRSHARGSHTRR